MYVYMCSDMYIYMYMYTYTHVYACMCVCARACACVRVWQVHAIVGISAKRGRETSNLLGVGVVSGSRDFVYKE